MTTTSAPTVRESIAWVAGLSVLSTVICLLGPQLLTPDGVGYFAMASAIREFKMPTLWTGSVHSWWPPGYSFILSPFSDSPEGFLNGVRLCSVISFSLILYLLVGVGRRVGVSRGQLVFLSVCLALSLPIRTVYVSVFSETVLLPLVVAALILACSERPTSIRQWALAGIVALSICVKLSALPLVVVLTWSLFRAYKKRHISLAKGILLVFGSLLPIGLWFLIGLFSSERFRDPFPGDPDPFSDVLRRSSEIMSRWLIPQVDSTDVLRISTAALLVGASVYLIMRMRRSPESQAKVSELGWRLAPAFVFIFLTIIQLVFAASTRKLDRIDNLLLAPVFIAIIFLLVHVWGAFGRHQSRAFRWVALAWVAYTGTTGLRADYGAGDIRNMAATSQIMSVLDEADIGTHGNNYSLMVSNHPDKVYWASRVISTWDPLLRRKYMRSVVSNQSNSIYLFMDGPTRSYLRSEEQVVNEMGLQLHHAVPGIRVYLED